MEADFWHKRWDAGQIGFHQGKPNAFLVDHLKTLNLPKGARIFLPLCGKTLDIAWLLAEGYHVIGAELSAIAIDQLFEELGVTPQTIELGPLKQLSADSIDIYVGDIFDLTQDILGPIDLTYDRAAFVALPTSMRAKYATHLTAITDNAPQLLITFQYDEGLITGPPFSIPHNDVHALYDTAYVVDHLAHKDAEGGVKGHPATEEIWHLKC